MASEDWNYRLMKGGESSKGRFLSERYEIGMYNEAYGVAHIYLESSFEVIVSGSRPCLPSLKPLLFKVRIDTDLKCSLADEAHLISF